MSQMRTEELEELAKTNAEAVRDETLDGLPSTGLLSFYDRLRKQVTKRVGKGGGQLGPRVAETLLLVPDIFILMLRLSLDKDVPSSTRALLASALAYFVLPLDLLPELALGPVGYVDDLVLAVGVLSHAFGGELEPLAAKYWSGSQKLREVLVDVLDSADSLLGESVYDRLRKLLAKQGVELD